MSSIQLTTGFAGTGGQTSSKRVLALLPDERLPDNGRLYELLAGHLDLTVVKMDKYQRRYLAGFLQGVDLDCYDRIVLELRFKHAFPQIDFLKSLPNLVLIEDDTWQNYVCFGKNQGAFSRYYKALQPRLIVSSGYSVSRSLQAQGFNAAFLGKGFDGTVLWNTGESRSIEAAFIGRLDHENYAPRKDMLLELQSRIGLQLLRTTSSDEYRSALNQIRFFVSADVMFGEYMIKNFEALACGCVLVAFSQDLDDEHLGFRDMENCLLYRNADELVRKLELVKKDETLVRRIANAGEKLARDRFEYGVLAKKYANILSRPLQCT